MRIIIAESQKAIRRLILSCLEKSPHDLLKASDLTGLEILLQQQADLLILDYSLLTDKISIFLEDLSRSHPRLPVILTSFKDQIRENSLNYKARLEQLTKPFTEENLMELVDQIIQVEPSLEKKSDEPTRFFSMELLPSAKSHPLMNKAIGFLRNVADSDITILISGESGVGKEAYAKRLHQLSRRRHHRFVGINCASIPANLLESELFGAERGAYTGSLQRHIGKFELAQKGTLLLDEISEMDIALQSKLLRVLQEREFYRIGGNEKVCLDVRIVATTNRDLRDWIKERKFREDLYYRLNVINVKIPPLRERLDDIPVLATMIIDRMGKENGNRRLTLSNQAIQQLQSYNWPGNIREMENILLRTFYMTQGKEINRIFFDDVEIPYQAESVPNPFLQPTLPLLKYGNLKVLLAIFLWEPSKMSNDK
ncbi:MAG: sigma-54-dependent Fis family transcriptional regulator [Deltaproteobacteria bacterium]|nr:MAG: sigma-54-dependent Fis family transcriptional regulator [Deltaproteobacteria bacterium]